MLAEEILFRPPSLENKGIFYLAKSMFVATGNNYHVDRCDNLTYAPVSPVYDTDFESDACIFGKKSAYANCNWEINNVGYFENIIDASPHFFVTYVEFVEKINLTSFSAKHLEDNESPSGLWSAHSVSELLKNIREWQIVHQNPFNVNHPMAEISNKFFEITQPSEDIINEIDSYPDMHLARFLKNDPNHRNHIDEFPQISNNVKDWFKQLTIQYAYKNFEERINESI